MNDDTHQTTTGQTAKLKILQCDGARADAEADLQLDREDEGDGSETEEFWAGRNHAMRRSARIAA